MSGTKYSILFRRKWSCLFLVVAPSLLLASNRIAGFVVNSAASHQIAPRSRGAGVAHVGGFVVNRRNVFIGDTAAGALNPTITAKHMTLFEDIGKIFGEGNDGNNDPETAQSSLVFSIPVKSIKAGGLRLALALHLMGQQNNPEQGSWKANQSEEGMLDLYYSDNSGSLTIRLQDDEITVDRLGSTPSLEFIVEESSILHKVLDELEMMIHEGDVKESDRLLVLQEPGDAIERAREMLAFS